MQSFWGDLIPGNKIIFTFVVKVGFFTDQNYTPAQFALSILSEII